MPVDTLIASLVNSGLMSGEEIGRFLKEFAKGSVPASGEELAAQLVACKRLTDYQSERLLAGESLPLVLGDYVILDCIGKGGMGVVYRAEHARMKRIVALKVLPPAYSDEIAIKRFEREIRWAARLVHRNIVAALDARVDRGVYYLIMEYVDGMDLAKAVRHHGSFSTAKAVDCTIQVAEGLAHAHKQGVVHRDIKPSNLLLSKDGIVKILDMGLVRLREGVDVEGNELDGDTLTQVTNSTALLGTVDYMAPEQAIDPRQADVRSDIYSLGCTLHFMLTGRPPFAGETRMQRVVAHRDSAVPSVRDLIPNVPSELDLAFQQMIAKRPENRYQTADELVTQLMALRNKCSLHRNVIASRDTDRATEVTRNRPDQASAKYEAPTATMPGSAKRRRGALIGASLVLLGATALIACGAYVWSKSKPDLPTVSPTRGASPDLLVAPFDRETAVNAQQQWADYLSLPVRDAGATGIDFVLIPPGTFTMGCGDSPEELAVAFSANVDYFTAATPRHEVTISRPFYMAAGEVTVAQFRQFVEATGYQTSAELSADGGWGITPEGTAKQPEYSWKNPGFTQEDDHPVVIVSWEDARAFCRWSSEVEQAEIRLPTEAEWEYCCRAGTRTTFWNGNDADGLTAVDNVPDQTLTESMTTNRDTVAARDGVAFTCPVMSLSPNPFGLYGMHGNVSEKCLDAYDPRAYTSEPRVDPLNATEGTRRVSRGGAFFGSLRMLRADYRHIQSTSASSYSSGFRVVRVIRSAD